MSRTRWSSGVSPFCPQELQIRQSRRFLPVSGKWPPCRCSRISSWRVGCGVLLLTSGWQRETISYNRNLLQCNIPPSSEDQPPPQLHRHQVTPNGISQELRGCCWLGDGWYIGPGLARNERKWGMSGEYLFHVITNEYYLHFNSHVQAIIIIYELYCKFLYIIIK